MADVAVTPTTLAMNTVSADILDTDGTAIGAGFATDQWAVAAAGHGDARLLLKFWDDGSGCTVTIKAGDRPPSQRAGLGDLAIAMAASDVRYIVVERSRFMHDDGKIRIEATDAGAECSAFILPKQN